jgi:hypothetical protein
MEAYNLKIIGEPTEFGNTRFLENYKFPNNTAFPESYKEFVKKFGYGRTLGQFFIYIPMDDYGDSWNIRTGAIKNTYYNDLLNNDIWFELKPDGNIELLKRLVPFAQSENGYYLFWDPEIMEYNEFDIYMTDFRGSGLRKTGKTLYEVLGKMTHQKYYKEFSPFFQKEPLPDIFECLKRIK